MRRNEKRKSPKYLDESYLCNTIEALVIEQDSKGAHHTAEAPHHIITPSVITLQNRRLKSTCGITVFCHSELTQNIKLTSS